MREQEGGDRRILWALLIGGAGVVVAIVALVIAISANSATNDDAKIAKAVRTEENRQIGGVRADLGKDVAAATLILRRLQDSSSKARRADAALRHDAVTAQKGVTNNRARIRAAQTSIANVQTTVGNLNAKIRGLTGSMASQAREQRSLTQRLKALQKKVASLP
jgi:peptidoglycan hydrolase CwlO-like protein